MLSCIPKKPLIAPLPFLPARPPGAPRQNKEQSGLSGTFWEYTGMSVKIKEKAPPRENRTIPQL
jgi:hypothetical protein